MHEGFTSEVELPILERCHTKLAPITDGDSEAGKLVSHVPLSLVKVAVEGGRLRHINSVNRLVRDAEDLGSLEAHDIAGELLLTWLECSSLDVKRVGTGVRQHVVHLKVPGS